MDLKTYLFTEGLGKDVFAKQLGIARHNIWRYCSGRGWPRLEVAKRIEKLTHGKVTAKEMFKGRPKARSCECCGRYWRKKKTRKQLDLFEK